MELDLILLVENITDFVQTKFSMGCKGSTVGFFWRIYSLADAPKSLKEKQVKKKEHKYHLYN